MTTQHETTRPTLSQMLHALWGMSRPMIMLSVLQVLVYGALLAWVNSSSLDWPTLAWGWSALLLVMAAIHYTNEYADHATDALTERTPFSGGSGMLAQGHVPRRLALQAAWITLGVGFLGAFVGWTLGILPLVSLVLLGIGAMGGWQYSLRPLKLAWRGWGELDNALLGGLVLTSYGYSLFAGQVDGFLIAVCIPFTLLAFNNLLATTWADRQADAQVGKYTLATRWPVPHLRGLHTLVIVAAFGVLALLTLTGVVPEMVTLLSLAALPLAVWSTLTYTRRSSPHASVWTMVVFLLAQIGGWLVVGLV